MVNFKVVALGAAGTKGALYLVNQEILSASEVLVINSTMADVPEEFKNNVCIIGDGLGGCGKEPTLGKQYAEESIQEDKLDAAIDDFIEPTTHQVLIFHSTEGGTGNGSASVVEDYIREVYNVPVMVYAFSGFEDDARGLSNTVHFANNLREDLTIQIISNKKFMDLARHNKVKAERLANEELAKRVLIATGSIIRESEQNIDDKDLNKTITTPGYMTVETNTIDKTIKTKQALIDLMYQTIRDTKSMDTTEPKAKRFAVILTIKEETEDLIDFSFNVIKEQLGEAFEIFTHIQRPVDNTESFAIIAAGMEMPKDEINEIYERYQERFAKVNTAQDSFFGSRIEITSNPFDTGKDKTQLSKAKLDYKNKFKKTETVQDQSPAQKKEQFKNQY